MTIFSYTKAGLGALKSGSKLYPCYRIIHIASDLRLHPTLEFRLLRNAKRMIELLAVMDWTASELTHEHGELFVAAWSEFPRGKSYRDMP